MYICVCVSRCPNWALRFKCGQTHEIIKLIVEAAAIAINELSVLIKANTAECKNEFHWGSTVEHMWASMKYEADNCAKCMGVVYIRKTVGWFHVHCQCTVKQQMRLSFQTSYLSVTWTLKNPTVMNWCCNWLLRWHLSLQECALRVSGHWSYMEKDQMTH